MKLKKFLSAIISAAMCFSLFATSVSADESIIPETPAYTETQDEYAFNAMSRYVSLENIGDSSDISISIPVTLNNLDDTSNNKTIYFAISNNSLVGMMTVDKVNGEFASSFMSINYNQVYGLLSNYRPMHMALSRTDSSGTAHAHGVSLSGITVLNTPSMYAYYYIVDPNVGRVSVEVPYDVMLDGSNFTYVASSDRTYTSWYRTVYKS